MLKFPDLLKKNVFKHDEKLPAIHQGLARISQNSHPHKHSLPDYLETKFQITIWHFLPNLFIKHTLRIAAFLFLVPFISFGQEQAKTEIPTVNEWKILEHQDYTIVYPSNWVLNKSGQMGISFVLQSPKVSPNDQFSENVNLLIQDLNFHPK